MTKKLLCLVLALVMLFSLAACKPDDGKENSSAEISSESADKDSSADDKTSSDANSADSSAADTTSDDSSDATSSDETSEEDTGYQPLLYKVEDGKGGVLYLLGSIHAGDERIDKLSDKVMNAYDASNYLCVEFDTVAFSEDQSKLMAMVKTMLCPAGTTIKDQLGEETYNACKKYLEDNGLYNSLYDYYGAYFWSSLVSEAMMSKSKLSSDYGVDLMFLTMAHDEGMEIREVESADFQYGMMLAFPTELWKLSIESYLRNEEFEISMLNQMFEVWLSGDASDIAELLETEYDDGIEYTDEQKALLADYDKQLVDDRNNGMTAKAEEYLAGGGTGFFVVGAAHIVGETGVAAQLKAKGYTVTIISGQE